MMLKLIKLIMILFNLIHLHLQKQMRVHIILQNMAVLLVHLKMDLIFHFQFMTLNPQLKVC